MDQSIREPRVAGNNFFLKQFQRFSLYSDVRFIIYEAQTGKVVAEHQIEVEQLFPHERLEF